MIRFLLPLPACLFFFLADGAPTKPEAEKTFPPLRVPDGFKAVLFACDPLIEYPSVIARGPKSGSLFVAIDYMTGLGTDIVRRDEIRLVEDTDGDGKADRAGVYATGFNSIQGLAYQDGTVYVMHAPHLTALRDTKGTGKADERKDLLTGLGLAPEKDQIRLHNANGVVVGHDGWLYLALGDHGCIVDRPEGDKLVLDGGGILRCRPDGRDLHVFSTGLRNIYDVALDEDLNVFVRDNENDGGDYKIRVCRSFFGADHGYPYLYHERPAEALAPLADLGLGSSAGVVCYLEMQFPAEYRGNLFSCEWGRAVVRSPLRRAGSSFAPVREIDFAAGAPDDPYGFKPTDLVVDRDGSLFVSDWADGQRPRRGRGRIYNIKHVGGKSAKPAGLDSEGAFDRIDAQQAIEKRGKQGIADLDLKQLGVRGRLHAVWILAKAEGAIEKLFALVKDDPDPRVQAQAVRALADLTDPVLVKHRLDAAPGDARLAARLAALAEGRDPQVVLEVVIALGRLRWADAPAWLRKNLKQPDASLAHAAQWCLRRSGGRQAVLKLLDEKSDEPFRAIALRAVAEQFDASLVDGLIDRLAKESEPARRLDYADALSRVHRKPAAPWTYWGFRPPPRPAGVVDWERTKNIEQALDRALADSPRAVRLPLMRRMLREKIPARTAVLGKWLEDDRDPESSDVVLTAMGERPPSEARPHLEAVLSDRQRSKSSRLLALYLFLKGLDAAAEEKLPALAEKMEDGPVLAELLRGIGRKPALVKSSPLLLKKTSSYSGEVRAAALDALASLGATDADKAILRRLGDTDARVRAAAASAAGVLKLRPATEPLLKLVKNVDPEVRRSSLDALRRLGEPRVLPLAVAALADRETTLKALEAVGELGGPEQASEVVEVARRSQSAEVLESVGKVLTGWAVRLDLSAAKRQDVERALAEVHGGSGVLLSWHVLSIPRKGVEAKLPVGPDPAPGWRLLQSAGLEARMRPGVADKDHVWLAFSEIEAAEAAKVEFFWAGVSPATVRLNGKVVHQRDKPGVLGPYPDRFEAPLLKGRNRVLVRLDAEMGPVEFQLRFRHRTATPERERLALAALSRAGNPARGREVFLNAEKSQCIKCHRLGEQGEKIGPELTGLGNRFSKIHIVESILEPSRTIAPSFETTTVVMKSGKMFVGVKIAETEAAITIADNEGRKHILARADVEEQRKSSVSTMPEGLEKRLTEDEFVDLMSFLVNLKNSR